MTEQPDTVAGAFVQTLAPGQYAAYAARTAAPEQVSAILRDPDSPLYPDEITVYCDDCGRTVIADYIVVDDMTGAERLGIARDHLREEGWQCDELGDFCPTCQPAGGDQS